MSLHGDADVVRKQCPEAVSEDGEWRVAYALLTHSVHDVVGESLHVHGVVYCVRSSSPSWRHVRVYCDVRVVFSMSDFFLDPLSHDGGSTLSGTR